MAINKRLMGLGTAAVAEAAAIKPSENFDTVLYTGSGSTQSITGGWIGKGGKFNGSSSTVLTTSSFANLNTFSISAFVNFNSVSGTVVIAGTDYKTGGSSGDTGWMFRLRGGNKLNLVRVVSGTFTNIEVDWTPSANTWYHIAATRTNTETKFYVDGSQQGSTQTTGTGSIDYASDAAFTIGVYRYQNTNYNVFNGIIDQVRFFDKALSSDEVTTLYGENSSPVDPDIVSGCIALYEFEDNVKDTANNGKYGKAAHFNGSNGSLDIASSDLIQNNTESFSFWFKDKFMFGFYDPSAASSSDRRRWFIDNNTAGSIKIQVNNDQYNYEQTGITEDSDWHHLAVVSDGKIYLDGTQLTNTFNTSYWVTDGTNGTSRDTIRIGSSDYIGSAGSGYIEGQMDDLKIFDTALSADAVDALYNNDTADSDFPDDPVAHYKFDSNALDETGDYDGTASNVVYGYDGTASNISYASALGFTPDLIWMKRRNTSQEHALVDSVRGANKHLYSDLTNAQVTTTNGVSSFDDNGWTMGANGLMNNNTSTYVGWCFKGGGSGSTYNIDGTGYSTASAAGLDDGSINPTGASVNTAAGFSIVRWNGTEANATISHGLSSAPRLILIKNASEAKNWTVYAQPAGATHYAKLNLTDNFQDADTAFNDTHPTDDVFSVGSASVANGSGDTMIAYCFADVDSYQKVGSYTGATPSQPVVETGFQPAFVMIKRTDTSGYDWNIYDNKRDTTNPNEKYLEANTSAAEATGRGINFLSNGFQIYGTSQSVNASGGTYIYLAIAADPDTTTPTKSKSFDVIKYNGDGAAGGQSITDARFSPDLVILKDTDSTENWGLGDSIRGYGYLLYPNLTNAQVEGSYIAVTDNGFDIKTSNYNANTNEYIAYTWKAGDHDDSLTEINTNGTIDSIVSVNDAAGFSIVKYTGNGTSGATVGTGLSQEVEFLIVKSTNLGQAWNVYVKDITDTDAKYLRLNENNGIYSTVNPRFDVSEFSSSVFGLGSDNSTNGDGDNYIAYCWTSVQNYSKIGNYIGSGSSGKQVTGLGFKPDFLLLKNSSSTGGSWFIYDSERGNTKYLRPDLNNIEGTDGNVVFDSDGFTINVTYTDHNKLNDSYIYMAFKIN
jgi:hypothetical protein